MENFLANMKSPEFLLNNSSGRDHLLNLLKGRALTFGWMNTPRSFDEIHETLSKLLDGSGKRLTDKEFKLQNKFAGCWKFDPAISDKNTPLADTMELGWLMRKALNNVEKVRFDVSREYLENRTRVWNIINVKEKRPWSGRKIYVKRKDRRKGMAGTWLEKTRRGFIVKMQWDDPYAAVSREEFSFVDANTMLVEVQVKRVTGESCNLRFYWRRQ